MLAAILAELLTDMGHDICAVCATAQDAVVHALDYRPDIMLVDVRLGQGSGVTAVATILKTTPIPHIFMSGDMIIIKSLSEQAVTLRKPFQEFELACALTEAVARCRAG